MIKKIIFYIRLAVANVYQKPEIYRRYLGVKIGKEARFTGKINFGTEPFLISIGEHVTLAHNVTFHTHDGGIWVFRDKYPDINVYGKITIGNNVFIGTNVIILPNVSVGDNVVIGAGSIVTKSVKSNVVVAGNPARVIKTIEQYEEKVLNDAHFIDSSKMTSAASRILREIENKARN